LRARAARKDRIIAFLKSLEGEQLVEDQPIGGVGRIHHDALVADVLVGIDLRPHHELEHPVAAARHDDHVGFLVLDQRHRVVDR
jgi:hypothetical protein